MCLQLIQRVKSLVSMMVLIFNYQASHVMKVICFCIRNLFLSHSHCSCILWISQCVYRFECVGINIGNFIDIRFMLFIFNFTFGIYIFYIFLSLFLVYGSAQHLFVRCQMNVVNIVCLFLCVDSPGVSNLIVVSHF